jgi:hypothetical protein
MELRHIRLIGFAVGALIVGLQTVLIARQWRKARGDERRKVLECGLFCLITALWQLGNLTDEAALALNFRSESDIFKFTFFIRRTALSLIPLSLSYLSPLFGEHSRRTEWLARFGRALRFALWPWSAVLLSFQVAWVFGWLADPSFMTFSTRMSVRLIPVFFIIFTIQSFRQIRHVTANQRQLKKGECGRIDLLPGWNCGYCRGRLAGQFGLCKAGRYGDIDDVRDRRRIPAIPLSVHGHIHPLCDSGRTPPGCVSGRRGGGSEVGSPERSSLVARDPCDVVDVCEGAFREVG